jgi:hypothetical protein
MAGHAAPQAGSAPDLKAVVQIEATQASSPALRNCGNSARAATLIPVSCPGSPLNFVCSANAATILLVETIACAKVGPLRSAACKEIVVRIHQKASRLRYDVIFSFHILLSVSESVFTPYARISS